MRKIQTPNLTLPLTLLFIFSSLLVSHPTLAQSAVTGISAIPPRLDINVNPGEAVTQEIKVRNESKTEKVFSTNVNDFIVTDNIGTPILIENNQNDTNRWAASNWIQVSPSQFKLKAGETRSLIVTVIAPANALPGGHYAMILHSPSNENTLNNNGAAVEAKVGTLAYITVPGNIKQDAKVNTFTGPTFLEFGPVDFKTTIQNLSDIHITPAGSITITNMLGGKTAQLSLTQTNIFPYTSRDFQNQLAKKWLFGRYKAQLNAAYGTAGGVVVATIFFWVMPWRFILLSATTIALIVVIVLLLKKRGKDQDQIVETKIETLENELETLKKKYKDN